MLLLMMFLLAAPGADHIARVKCRTLQPEITLRRGPSASSTAADSIACGQDVSVTEEEKDHAGWVRIKTKADQEGYIRTTLLEMGESKPTLASAPTPPLPSAPTPDVMPAPRSR